MPKLLAGCVVLAVLAFGAIANTAAQSLNAAPKFATELEAQRHCPGDIVVWVNAKTGVYHFRGQRWYGNTKEGYFECRSEADREGDRPTHNGQ